MHHKLSRWGEDLDAIESQPDRALPAPGRSTLTSRHVMRKERDDNGVAANADAAVDQASGSSGAALPADLRERFETSLGADLSAVRVHTGDASAQANDAVGARAYATGQDIHFGAGQYDPASSDGQFLIAHEVAHTVQQQGAAPSKQFKLAVSSPGDSAEVEADIAAHAMVSGATATVSGGGGTLARKEEEKKPASPLVALGGFELNASHEFKETELSYLKITPSLEGTIAFKPKGAEVEPKAGEVKASAGKAKNGATVKIEAEKKLGEGMWGFVPKLHPEFSLDKKGPHFSLGLNVEHEAFDFHGVNLGPYSIEPKLFDWSPGKELHLTFVELSAGLSIKAGTFMGYDVTPSLKIKAAFEPNWKKIGQVLLERVGAELLVSAGLIAAPFIAFAGGLVMWAKAGHEFDEVSNRISGLHANCRAATDEALGGEHKKVTILGSGDLAADVTTTANEIRKNLATKLAVPEAAIAAAAKLKPGLKDQLYVAAWKATWPGLKAKLLEGYKDTFWTSYKFERQWLESFETGGFATGYSGT